MRQKVFPSDVVLPLAEAAATRLCRRLRLSPSDRDDLRQQLLVDLIRRLHGFDPARGSLGAFAGVVMRHESARIATRMMRERQAHGGPLLSLDAPTADGGTLGEALSDKDSLATWHGPANRRGRMARPERTLARNATTVVLWPMGATAGFPGSPITPCRTRSSTGARWTQQR